MFTTEIGGGRHTYPTLSDIAGVFFELARTKRDQARNVELSRQFLDGQSSAYSKAGVIIDCIRIGSIPVHEYITRILSAAKEARAAADKLTTELHEANARIAELERLLQNADRIGDPHTNTGGGAS